MKGKSKVRCFYQVWTRNEDGEYDYSVRWAPYPNRRFYRKRHRRMTGK